MAVDPLVEAQRILDEHEAASDPIVRAKRVLAEFNLPEGGTPEYQQGVAEELAPLQEKVTQGAGLSVREGEPSEKETVAAWREAANRPLLGKPVAEVLTDIPRNAIGEMQGLASNIMTSGLSTARMAGSMPDLVQAAVTTPKTGWEEAQKQARRKERKENWEEFVTAAEGGGLLPLTFLGGPLGAVAGRLGPIAGAIASRIPTAMAVAPTVVPTVKFAKEFVENPVETAVANPLGVGLGLAGGVKGVKAGGNVLAGRYQPKVRAAPDHDSPSWYVRNPKGELVKPKGSPSEVPLHHAAYDSLVPGGDGARVQLPPSGLLDKALLAASEKMKGTPVANALNKTIGRPKTLGDVIFGTDRGPVSKAYDAVTDAPRQLLSKGVEKVVEKYPGAEAYLPGVGERQAFVNQATRAGLSPSRVRSLLQGLDSGAAETVRKNLPLMDKPETAEAIQKYVADSADNPGFKVTYNQTTIPMRDILSPDDTLAARSAGGLIRAVEKSRAPGGRELVVDLPWTNDGAVVREKAKLYVGQAIPTLVKAIIDTSTDANDASLKVREAVKRIARPDLSGKESFAGQKALQHTYRVLSEANATAAQAGLLENIMRQVPELVSKMDADAEALNKMGISAESTRAWTDMLSGKRVEATGSAATRNFRIPTRRLDLDKLNSSARSIAERVFGEKLDLPEPIARFIEQAGKKESAMLKALSDVRVVKGSQDALRGAMTILGHTAIKANPPTRIFNGVSNYSIGEWLAASTGIPSPMVHPVKWMALSKKYINDLYAGRLGVSVGKDPQTGRSMSLAEVVVDLGGDPMALAEIRLHRGSDGAPAGAGRFSGTLSEGAARAADAKALREARVRAPLEQARANVERLTREVEPENTRVTNLNEVVGDTSKQDARLQAALEQHAKTRSKLDGEIARAESQVAAMKAAGRDSSQAQYQLQQLLERRAGLIEDGAMLHDMVQEARNSKDRVEAERLGAANALAEKRALLKAESAAVSAMEKAARSGGPRAILTRGGELLKAYYEAYRDVPNATYSQGYFSDFAHRIPAIQMLMERGYPYKAALSIVKDAYLDYGKNGKAVQALSAVAMPFFGFSAAAFPKNMQYLAAHPLRALVWMQSGDAAHRAWAMALDIDEEERKKMLRDTPATPVYRGADGKLHTLDTTRGGTKTAIQEAAGAVVKPGGGWGEGLKTLARGNPLLPAISQAFTGNDPRTGRRSVGTLERVTDPVKTFAIPPYFRTLVGDVLWQRRPDSQDKDSRVLAPERITPTGEKVPILADVGQVLAGIRTREYDRDERVSRRARGEAADLQSRENVRTEYGELLTRLVEAKKQGRNGLVEDLKAKLRELGRENNSDVNEIMSQ